MLKGIPKILPPELLKILCEMGHGDELTIGDGNFPGHTNAKVEIRMDGHNVPEILDAILETLVKKGKGLEMNTSGLERGVGFLPEREFFVRFRQLGGEIVTVGSDAHRCDRVGQHTRRACEILMEIFGYVCTFENRQPIFHKF